MACKAILSALEDAGLTIQRPRRLRDLLVRVRSRAGRLDPRCARDALRRVADSGGGGRAGSIGLASAAIVGGMAEVCVTLMTLQQVTPPARRLVDRRRRRRRRWRRQPLRRRWHLADDGVHRELGPHLARATASRCSRSGTCTTTARRASTSPRSRSRSATTRSGRPTSLHAEPAHARRLLQRAHDLRPAVPLRLHDGDRRRGRGDHHVGRARARPAPAARVRHGVRERRHGPVGPGDLQLLPAARRVLRVVGSPARRAAHVRDGGRRPRRRRRRAALRPLLADGAHADRGLRLLSPSARAARSSPRATSAGPTARSR